MKKILFFLLLLVAAYTGHGQTFSEWFKQKKTQTKYSLAQIAALQAYLGVLRKGYNIAKEGLGTINDIKTGDFNLHSVYFSSLKNVNPAIKGYSKIAAAITLQVNTMQVYSSIKKEVGVSEWLNEPDKAYTGRVFKAVLDKCSDNMELLTSLTTNGQLELKDDERMERIDAVYADMEDLYSFIQHFSGGIRILSAQRQKEYLDSKKMQSLSGIVMQ